MRSGTGWQVERAEERSCQSFQFRRLGAETNYQANPDKDQRKHWLRLQVHPDFNSTERSCRYPASFAGVTSW